MLAATNEMHLSTLCGISQRVSESRVSTVETQQRKHDIVMNEPTTPRKHTTSKPRNNTTQSTSGCSYWRQTGTSHTRSWLKWAAVTWCRLVSTGTGCLAVRLLTHISPRCLFLGNCHVHLDIPTRPRRFVSLHFTLSSRVPGYRRVVRVVPLVTVRLASRERAESSAAGWWHFYPTLHTPPQKGSSLSLCYLGTTRHPLTSIGIFCTRPRQVFAAAADGSWWDDHDDASFGSVFDPPDSSSVLHAARL